MAARMTGLVTLPLGGVFALGALVLGLAAALAVAALVTGRD